MFVALAASLLALLATADAQNLCGTDSIGKLYSAFFQVTHQLPDVPLPAGLKEVNVNIANEGVCERPQAVGSSHGGTVVTACDYDVAPVVRLTNVTHAVVYRGGGGAPGILHTTAHCFLPGHD